MILTTSNDEVRLNVSHIEFVTTEGTVTFVRLQLAQVLFNSVLAIITLSLRLRLYYVLIIAHCSLFLQDDHVLLLRHLLFTAMDLVYLQLTAAPKVLPPSLVSADFAANQLTKIYPYTFGHKPKLR